jgi:uncharacterized protein (DUF1778 family)
MPVTPASSATANERLEARVTSEQKELFREAASLQGVTLTEFIVRSAHDAAVRSLETRHLLQLSLADQKAFVRAILHPAAPDRRLRAAWSRHESSDRSPSARGGRARVRRAR